MKMKFQIRLLEERDLDQVARIEAENFSTPWTRKDYADCITREEALVLVAQEADKDVVLGYIGAIISFDEADICNVSVDRQYEGNGIGTALVDAMMLSLQRRNVTSVFLEVRESNMTAIHLYRKFHFKEISVRKNYYKKPTENALIMAMKGDDSNDEG